MTYTWASGARNYNSRLHYSLYGGVEYFPDRSLALKELLPLVAIPVVGVALLAAIINFHIPAISRPGSGSTLTTTGSQHGSSVVSSLVTHNSSPNDNSPSGAATGSSTAQSGQATAASGPSAPVVQETVNGVGGVTGGMGSGEETGGGTNGGSGTTTPPSTSSIVNASASVSGTTATVGVDVFVPGSDKTLVSTHTTIDP